MFTTRTEHERPEHLDMVEMNIHVSYHVNQTVHRLTT